MDFGNYLWRLLQYAFWNPSNPVLSPIAWVACLWALFIGVVPHVHKLRHLQQPLRKISNTWRVWILVILILSSIIAAAYSMQNRPILIVNYSGTVVGDNATPIIYLEIENIGANPAYRIVPILYWAPESELQNLFSPGMTIGILYLYPHEQCMLPLQLELNDSDKWYIYYIYYRLEYSDAPNKGIKYAVEYWYLFDFSTRCLSNLSPTQKEAFQPYIDELFAD
jgi:hypothetical protein